VLVVVLPLGSEMRLVLQGSKCRSTATAS